MSKVSGAHASVGCLHVRPVLNMKIQDDVDKMRNIANETSSLVKKFKGSYSGEHGDGIARSEFNEVMFGKRMTNIFKSIKNSFDPLISSIQERLWMLQN